jgi:hypothetical protein
MNTINLNFDSVKYICNDANQALVYGWKSCLYEEVANTLINQNSPIKKVFLHNISGFSASKEERTTLEGRVIEQIPTTLDSISRTCKTAITNLMLENYKRSQEKSPLIPLIFCYDIKDNNFITTPESITSRGRDSNKRITNKELRRCYKMCCELENDPELKAIAEVARESLKLAKLAGDGHAGYRMELLQPFWESPEWDAKWQERVATKRPADPSKVHLWREQLKSAVSSYNNQNPQSELIVLNLMDPNNMFDMLLGNNDNAVDSDSNTCDMLDNDNFNIIDMWNGDSDDSNSIESIFDSY